MSGKNLSTNGRKPGLAGCRLKSSASFCIPGVLQSHAFSSAVIILGCIFFWISRNFVPGEGSESNSLISLHLFSNNGGSSNRLFKFNRQRSMYLRRRYVL
jgi:hypothetical protein